MAFHRGKVSPDGLDILLSWNELVVGGSMFVPCIDSTQAKSQLKRAAADFGYSIESRVVVENGKLGVRFWRTM